MSLFNVGFVIFPDLTQLDFTGPQQVLSRLPQSAMHIIAKTGDLVPTDSKHAFFPEHIRGGAASSRLFPGGEGAQCLLTRRAAAVRRIALRGSFGPS
jgi:cyclohexyl-isocyanide hydratase